MSGRCKACDVILFEDELAQKWPGSNEFVDLCNRCLEIALDPDSVQDFYEVNNDEHYEE